MKKSFWLINTARGNQVVIEHLVNGLKANKVKGVCLDVLDIETASPSFEKYYDEYIIDAT